jgi:single-strand DNA-binding protein
MNNFVLQVEACNPKSQIKQSPGKTTTVAMFQAKIDPISDKDNGGLIDCRAFGAAADHVLHLLQAGENPAAKWLILTGSLQTGGTPELTASAIHESVEPVDEAINSVALVGRAGRDPEARYFESGSCVANLTLAINRRRDEEPDWFNLEIWGKQAQVAADYVRKGSLLGIVGSLRFDRWIDRASGQERSKPVIRVDRLELLGSRRDSDGSQQQPARTASQAAAQAGGDQW